MANERQTILLIGDSGQVGWELQRTLASLGRLVVADQNSSKLPLDLASPDDIRSVIREVRPELIVNAAAYTAVDKAETEQDLAMAINGTAPGILAEQARETGAGLVHYSTDYVFDGKATSPYSETDTPSPINVYGRTKLAGDQAIEAVGGAYLILRTSWVYGTRGNNFFLTMLRLARERENLQIVDDQAGSPTWSRMIAESTAQVLARAPIQASRPGVLNCNALLKENAGIYNLSSPGKTTWYGFARAILEGTQRAMRLRLEELTPITSSEYPLPAPRPAFSVLSGEKLRNVFGLSLPEWQSGLESCMEECLAMRR